MAHITAAFGFLRRNKLFFIAWAAVAVVISLIAFLGRGSLGSADLLLFVFVSAFPALLLAFTMDSSKAQKAIQKTHLRRQSLATRAFTVIWDGTQKHPLFKGVGGDKSQALIRLLFTPEMVAIEQISKAAWWTHQFGAHQRGVLDTHAAVLEALRPAGFHDPDHVWFDINALAVALADENPDFQHIVNLIDDIDSFFARIAPAPETTAQ